jgi:hypothetical protein
VSEDKRILYDNLVNLINECIAENKINTLLETIEYIARKFNIYLRLEPRYIAIIKLKEMPYDNGVEIYVVNRYGLEISLRIFKMDKYVDNVEIYYSLAIICG